MPNKPNGAVLVSVAMQLHVTHCGTVHGARHASHVPARHGLIATQNSPTVVCSGPAAARQLRAARTRCMCQASLGRVVRSAWWCDGKLAQSCCRANPDSRCRYNAINLFTHKHVHFTGHTATVSRTSLAHTSLTHTNPGHNHAHTRTPLHHSHAS
jgi:hypothetical protein